MTDERPSLSDDAKREILAAIARFRDAYEAGDADGVGRCYSDSLVKLRQGAAPETKDEVVSRVRAVLRESAGRLEVTNEEIEARGDLAFVRGRFVVTLLPRAGGPATEIRRRFVEIWRKEDGAWRVARTLDNAGPD
jgi:ketosteroid isomerase-like protein